MSITAFLCRVVSLDRIPHIVYCISVQCTLYKCTRIRYTTQYSSSMHVIESSTHAVSKMLQIKDRSCTEDRAFARTINNLRAPRWRSGYLNTTVLPRCATAFSAVVSASTFFLFIYVAHERNCEKCKQSPVCTVVNYGQQDGNRVYIDKDKLDW